MNLTELRAEVALGEDSRRHLTSALTCANLLYSCT